MTQSPKDELIDYVNTCVKNNSEDSLIGKMALLAEQALIFNETFNDTVETISEKKVVDTHAKLL